MGSLAFTVLQTSGRLLPLGSSSWPVLALAPSEFGRYSTASAFVVIGGLLADFGTTTVIVRRVSRDPDGSDTLLTRTFLACLGLGVASALAVAAVAVLAGYPAATRTDVLLAALALPTSACLTSVLGALDGRGLIARSLPHLVVPGAVMALGGAV